MRSDEDQAELPPVLSVTILGSAGTFPHVDNPCSGYLVRTPSTVIWVDAGPGTFAALQGHVALADVDAIVLTHEHPDHWIEIPVVRNAARYVLGLEGIAVFGTAGTRRLAETVIGSDLAPTLAWTTVTADSTVTVGDISVHFARTDHPVETLAVAVEASGRRMAYSADTGSAWSLASLDSEGVGFDLAICEATLDPADADVVQHLTAAQAGAMARDAGVRRLVLTHLYAGDAARRADEAAGPDAFAAPVEVARSGMIFSV